MKKIIVLALGIVLAVSAQAQTYKTLTWSNGLTLDTVDNTETHYANVDATSHAKSLAIVVKVLKISGTVAGTISYQGSNDGTVFATIGTDTATDASANYSHEIAAPLHFRYYRVSWTGAGTMSASIAGTSYKRP